MGDRWLDLVASAVELGLDATPQEILAEVGRRTARLESMAEALEEADLAGQLRAAGYSLDIQDRPPRVYVEHDDVTGIPGYRGATRRDALRAAIAAELGEVARG